MFRIISFIISLLLCFSTVVQCSLCDWKDLSCSYQLWTNNTEDACTMFYYLRNSSHCRDEFPEAPTKMLLSKRGIIKITPIKWPEQSRTSFQITAHNISWTNLKFRFKQQGTEQKCMKREFLIKDVVPADKYLTYDCPWSSASIEDKIVEFEYAFGVNNKYDEGKRTFVLHVPKSELIKYYHTLDVLKLKLFSYVETTNPYHLVYKINVAPPQVNVTAYEIYVNYTKENVTRIDGPRFKGIESAILDVIDFGYDTFGVPGKYVFYTRPWECTKCGFSVSAPIIIPETSTIITIGIVGVSCLIPIFLIILYMYFKVDIGSRPRVLLVTTPANDAHRTIGLTLSNILKQKYNIETMMDIVDIKSTTNEIPSNWLKKAFEHATHIVILTSDHKPETSIYRNMDLLLYNLLNTTPMKVCCKLEFPFTQEPKLHFIFNYKFRLMRDYNSFINFICNRGFMQRIKDRLLRKHFYHDLDVQITNYNKAGRVNSTMLECCELESDQNELNNLKSSSVVTLSIDRDECCEEHDSRENLPREFRKIADDCLMNVMENKTKSDVSNESDDDSSEISDNESDIAINPLVLSLLKKVSNL